jgi:hypothetical protein
VPQRNCLTHAFIKYDDFLTGLLLASQYTHLLLLCIMVRDGTVGVVVVIKAKRIGFEMVGKMTRGRQRVLSNVYQCQRKWLLLLWVQVQRQRQGFDCLRTKEESVIMVKICHRSQILRQGLVDT